MHISFLTDEYPHRNTSEGGGIGTSIKNLATGLIKNNVNVTVFVIYAEKDLIFFDEGIRIVCIPYRKYVFLSWYFYRKYTCKRINSFIKKDDIDCIEVSDWQGFSAFSKYDCPVIIKLHGSYTYFNFLTNRKKNKALLLFEGNALRRADAIVSVSEFTLTQTNMIFSGLKVKQQTVINNGINVDEFKYCFNENRSKVKRIIYFGSLMRKKGVLEIPHIFNRVHKVNNNVSLTLIGRDVIDYISGQSSWEMMRNLFSADAINNVSYLGSVSYSEVYSYLTESDVCIFPSFAEAFPVSWLEAMACGIPIVASNIGWAKEVIDDNESGFLVDPLDHNLYAEKVLNLMNDNQLSKMISKNAHEKVLKYFQLEKISNTYVEFYKQIVES